MEFGTHGVGQEEAVSLPVTELVRQRSMLVILIAACTTARTAFEAADNVVDAQLCDDLNRMIERSESELEKLNLTINATATG
jgi:hypothetical protein